MRGGPYTKVESIDHLKTLSNTNIRANSEERMFFIQLNFGARSVKQIMYTPESDAWDVLHEIDDNSYQYQSTKELENYEDHITEAIRKGALWHYGS
tara:strand:- start:145 stop:432 length:288 start_codon:yes stop_codon:yes gene_type:complete